MVPIAGEFYRRDNSKMRRFNSYARFIILTISLAVLQTSAINQAQAVTVITCSIAGDFSVTANEVTTSHSCEGVAAIPEGVTAINANAFQNSTLTSVTLPSTLLTIGDYAFDGSQLTSVVIPQHVTDIGAAAFSGSQLVTVTINSDNLIIHNAAFQQNFYLTTLTVGNGNVDFGSQAFYNNYTASLTSVTFGTGTYVIGAGSFFGMGATSLTIPNSVTSIGAAAFMYSQLHSVIIPNSVTSIGDSAFMESQITSVNISSNVTSIGERAFYMGSLRDITVDPANTVYASDSAGVLFSKDMHTLLNYPRGRENTSYTVPSSVTTIASYALGGTANLHNVVIPEGITTLAPRAFEANSNLTTLTVPSTLLTYSPDSFQDSNNICYLTNNVSLVDHPVEHAYFESIKKVSCPPTTARNIVTALTGTTSASVTFTEPLFSGSSPITSYTISSNIGGFSTTLSGAAGGTVTVSGLTPLTKYRFKVTANNSTEHFDSSYSNEVLTPLPADFVYLPCGTSGSFRVNSLGMITGSTVDCAGTVDIPAHVTRILANAFNNRGAVTSVTIGPDVTDIGSRAFYGTQIPSVDIPASVTTLERDSFYNFDITAINVDPANLNYSSIDGVLFDKAGTTLIRFPNMKSITTYTIPSSVHTIGYKAFEEIFNVQNIVIPNSVTTISPWAFKATYALESVSIGSGVTEIPDGAFTCNPNTGPSSITFTGALTSIGNQAFSGARFTHFTVPNSVTSIGNEAFAYNAALESVSLGSGLVSLGTDVFSGADSLTSVTYSGIEGIAPGYALITSYSFPGAAVLTSTLAPPSASVSEMDLTSFKLSYTAPAGTTSVTARIYQQDGVTLVVPAISNFVSGTVISGLQPKTPYKLSLTAIGNGTTYLTSAASGLLSVSTISYPSYLKIEKSPSISFDGANFICTAPTYIFMRYGTYLEQPNVNSYEYSLIANDKKLATVTTSSNLATFASNPSWKGLIISCRITAQQEGVSLTAMSSDSPLITQSQVAEKTEIATVTTAFYAANRAATQAKSAALARILAQKNAAIAKTKKSSEILKASKEYKIAFAKVISEWKAALAKAKADQLQGIADAAKNRLKALEKAGLQVQF